MEQIGSIIKDIRKKNNLTQNEFASILGVTFQAVSKWENDKSIPDITILKDISNKFNVDLNYLISGKKVNINKKSFFKKNMIIITAIIFIIISICIFLLVFSLVIAQILFGLNIKFQFKRTPLKSSFLRLRIITPLIITVMHDSFSIKITELAFISKISTKKSRNFATSALKEGV